MDYEKLKINYKTQK